MERSSLKIESRRTILTALCGLSAAGCTVVVAGGVATGGAGFAFSEEIGEFTAERASKLRDFLDLKEGKKIKISEIQKVADSQISAFVTESKKYGREFTAERIKEMRAGLLEHYRRTLRWRFEIVDDINIQNQST